MVAAGHTPIVEGEPPWRQTSCTRLTRFRFIPTSGIETVAIGPGSATVRLPERAEFLSYLGAAQGGAVYAAAEAAASAAIAGLLGDELAKARLVVAGSSIAFTRPAVGELTATAALAEDPATIRRRLMRDGATLLASIVVVRDAEARTVARVEYEWRPSGKMDAFPGLPALVA